MAQPPAPKTEQQQKADAAREHARAELRAAIQWVTGTKQGRLFAWYLLQDVGCLLSQSDMGEATHASARNAGRRDVALELLALLRDNALPADYRLMWSERVGISNPNGTTPT